MKLIASPNVIFDIMPMIHDACLVYLCKETPDGNVICRSAFHTICSQRFRLKLEIADVLMELMVARFKDFRRVPHGIKFLV